jgi:small subunit ribosomal protein S11
MAEEQPITPAAPVPAAPVELSKEAAALAAKEAAALVAKQAVAALLDPEENKPKVVKAKGSKNITSGIVHVLSTFNNTIVSITDHRGNVFGWSSAGKMGFKGSRKSTAYAAQMVSQDACRQAMGHGLREAEVRVKGPGAGRESAVRAVSAIGVEVTTVRDVTPVPHNGCRPPKARRV